MRRRGETRKGYIRSRATPESRFLGLSTSVRYSGFSTGQLGMGEINGTGIGLDLSGQTVGGDAVHWSFLVYRIVARLGEINCNEMLSSKGRKVAELWHFTLRKRTIGIYRTSWCK